MKRKEMLSVIIALVLALPIMTSGGIFKKKVKEISLEHFYIFYIDQYQVVENPKSFDIRQDIYDRFRQDVEIIRQQNGSGLLYYSLSSPGYYYSLDSLDIFLQKVSQSRYELTGSRIEDFIRIIQNQKIDLSNKIVHLNIYLNSYNTYYTSIKDFLTYDIYMFDVLNKNRDNVNIKIYVPFNFIGHEKDRYLFVEGKQPIAISNWTIINTNH